MKVYEYSDFTTSEEVAKEKSKQGFYVTEIYNSETPTLYDKYWLGC